MAKIVLTIHSLGAGGAEKVSLQFAQWLLDEGHDVTIATSARSAQDFYPLPHGLHRFREQPLPWPLNYLGVLCFPLRVYFLRRFLKSKRFDLAIGMTTLPSIKLLLAATNLSLPVIVSERIFPGLQELPLLWRFLRRLTYPRADLHLVQTKAVAQWLHNQRLTNRTAVLPNAIPWPLFRHPPTIDPSMVLNSYDKLVLAVGTKPFQKGFDRLVSAFSVAVAKQPGWKLAIAGISPADWPANWPALPIGAEAALLLGRVGNLADWYERADLFVLSSRSEGIPNVLLEAMASGCACLAIDCPTGPSELIDHGVNGWLIPVHSNATQLSEALASLMSSPDKRKFLAEGALAVRHQFSDAIVRQKFLEILSPFLCSYPSCG